jgi:3-hydroxybutyryl-CoA dehydratase/enoyl-CoA hydratase
MMKRELKVGDTASITRLFTDEDVRLYADLSTDHNPVHLDEDFAKQTQFGQRIVHGMLVSSLFSALLGEHLPGHGTIYMSQHIQFKAPVYLNMPVIATVEIVNIREGKPIVTLQTTCVDESGKLLVTGEAVMFVPWLKA